MMKKIMIHRRLFIALAFLALSAGLLLSACSPKAKTDDRESTLLARIAEDKSNPELYEQLIFLELLSLNQPQKAVDIFEQNADLLQTRPMARIYYATAVCRLAGDAKASSDQLKWVRKGIGQFDALVREYPDEPRVYLYRAITYSNFPSILGVDGIVLSDIDKVNIGLATGHWQLESGERRQLSQALINLAMHYNKKAYLDQARAQMARDGLSSDPNLLKAVEAAAGAVK